MAYKLIENDFAIADILDAMNYYQSISIELCLRFQQDLLVAFNKLEKSPYNYYNINEKYRRINPQYFPYMLIYNI